MAVCVIGETVRNKLFSGQNPIGNQIRLQKLSCEVIGVLEAKGQNTMGRDQDDVVVVPIRIFQRRIAGNEDVSIIQVSTNDGTSTDYLKRDIRRLARSRGHLSSNQDDNFNVMDMKEIASMLCAGIGVFVFVGWSAAGAVRFQRPDRDEWGCALGAVGCGAWLIAGAQGGEAGSD